VLSVENCPLVHAAVDVAGGVKTCVLTIDGSTEIVEAPGVLVMSIPMPLKRFLADNSARKSVPPVTSKAPPVTVQLDSGMELDGNDITPEAYVHLLHVRTTVLPAVKFPAPST
jgi:hypothetical protein